ncbi:MAG: hypothetical protein KDI98_02705 [Hyphomicrobiaceae bacterium]|nr:hypothetical protein [Hyphomicrobiaceae bacterium]
MMRKRIKNQIIKMVIAVIMVSGLVGWQFEFVWTGLTSNIYLNMTIVGMFLFGIVLAFRSALSLKNEVIALNALTEAYDDIRMGAEREADEPYWRHYRCLEPGIVFHRPRLLGHVFDLTYEKMMRARKLQLSIGTMQSLMQELNSKLADDRSMLNYVTGLLVFLGLIGTFIGLMGMVSSVGGIIGGIANMDGGDSTEAFKKLITDLQGPLVGMATGFSSSLFGLFGSLTLGLLGRFLNLATGVLRSGLEGWLAAVSEIESDEADNEHALKLQEKMAAALDEANLRARKANETLDRLAMLTAHSVKAQAEQVKKFAELSEALSQGKPLEASAGEAGASPPSTERLEALTEALDNRIASSFSDLSRAMESAFLGFADVLRVSELSRARREQTAGERRVEGGAS